MKTTERIPTNALDVFVWASSTSNTYLVSVFDKRAGYDYQPFPRRELKRFPFPCPLKPNGWPDLDAGYRAASDFAATFKETLRRNPRLGRRNAGLEP